MYGGMGMGYNAGYVEPMAVGGISPYYNQPMMMGGPNVTVVENYGGGYGGMGMGGGAYGAGVATGAEAACAACCCLEILCCCLL